MAKRIISFDIIRGWAILGNILVHFFMMTSQVEGLAEEGNLDQLGVTGFILMGFIIIFGHWRGLFLLISAAVHWYTMKRKLDAGIPRGIILRQELLKGFVLWLWAMLFYVFIGEFTLSKAWVEGEPVIVDWTRMYHADQFVNIAWAILISAIVFYIITANEKMKKPIVGALTFTGLGLLFIFLANPIYNAANNFWGIDFHLNEEYLLNIGNKGWWDYIVRYFANQAVGRESPLFTHYAYSAVGSIIGIFISGKTHPTKKNFLSWGYGLAGFSILFGVFWFLVVDKALTLSLDEIISLTADFHVHPIWYVFVTSGLLIIVVLSIFASIEFNKKLNVQRRLRLSYFSRRAGFLSLSVYSLASIQAFLRLAMWGIFSLAGSTNADMFRTEFGLPTGWVIFMLLLELGLWFFILWIWGKARYIGSPDWLFALILKGPTKMKKDKKWLIKDPLDLQDKVIDPEVVLWIPTEIESIIDTTDKSTDLSIIQKDESQPQIK